jgi:cation diffusion facilitator CzcD-associated flavoprotein CzcO
LIPETTGSFYPSKERKKVAVIGAGPAGLVMAKESLAEGHTPVVFERGFAIGRVWQCQIMDKKDELQDREKRGRVLSGTLTSSSSLNTHSLTSLFKPKHLDQTPFSSHNRATWIISTETRDTMTLTARCVHVNTSVIRVQAEQSGADSWRVEAKTIDQTKTHIFDAIAVCSGQTNVPKRVCLLVANTFT